MLLCYFSLNAVNCCAFAWKFLSTPKIARWSHCNADSLNMLKANYMLIRLLCVYRMITYVGKILLWNSKWLLRKLQKILRGYFFAAPCRFSYRSCIRLSNAESGVSTLNSDNSSNIAYSSHVSTKCFCTLMSENLCEGGAPTFLPNRARSGLNPALTGYSLLGRSRPIALAGV